MSKKLIVMGLLIAATPLSAADKGRIGLVARPWSSTQVGVMWHVSEKVALRPATGIGVGSTTDTQISPTCGTGGVDCADTTVDWSSLSGGLDLLRYFGTTDGFTPYLAMGLDYTHSRNGDGGYTSGTFHTVTPSLRLGLQHPLSERVGVFGEAGVRSSWYRRNPPSRGLRTSSWSVHTFVASAGLVLYLN